MWLAWWLAVAHAGKWDDAPSDVQVDAVINTSVDHVHRVLADLANYKALFPEECADKWLVRHPTTGVDATIDVRYNFGPLRRKLTGVITRDEPGLVFQIEHKGPEGWFTQFKYRPGTSDGTTIVTMLTPLHPPPWPLTAVFHQQVRPAMIGCYEGFLRALRVRINAELSIHQE